MGTIIISFAVGFAVGYIFLAVSVARAIEKNKAELEQQAVQHAQIDYALERHNDILYAFDTSDSFIAQGANYAELSENMKQRFPDNTFRLVRYSTNISDELISQWAESIVLKTKLHTTIGQEADERAD